MVLVVAMVLVVVTCSSNGVSVRGSWDTLASSLVTLPPSTVFQASQGR